MTFTLSPATRADIPGILDAWIAANSDSERMLAFIKMPGLREYLAQCYAHSIKQGQNWVMVMTEESERGNRRVGAFAKMSFEKGGQPPTDWRDRWKAELPESMPTEAMEGFWTPLGNRRLAVMGERPHYFLEMMATHPEFQKKGLASTIVKWACERADSEGVEFYLDASVKGRPLYEKCGFVVDMKYMDPGTESYPMRRSFKTE